MNNKNQSRRCFKTQIEGRYVLYSSGDCIRTFEKFPEAEKVFYEELDNNPTSYVSLFSADHKTNYLSYSPINGETTRANIPFSGLKAGSYLYIADKAAAFDKHADSNWKIEELEVKDVERYDLEIIIKLTDGREIPFGNIYKDMSFLDQYTRLYSTSKEHIKQKMMEFVQDEIKRADNNIASIKKELDDAVKYRNSLTEKFLNII